MGVYFSKPDDIVVLLGPVEANKSTFANVAARFTPFTSQALPVGKTQRGRCTKEVQLVQCKAPGSNRQVILVDTPGFGDTLTIPDIVTMVIKHLNYTYFWTRNYRIAGILYFHPLTQGKMTIDPINYLDSFARLCGPNPAPRIVLVTTQWMLVPTWARAMKTAADVEKSWTKMKAGGSGVMRFHDTIASAWEIIDDLVIRRY